MPGGPPPRPLPSLRFRRIRALLLLVVLITVPATVVHLAKSGMADASARDPGKRSQAAAPPPAPTSESAVAELSQVLPQRNAGFRERLSVAVTDLGTGASAAYPTDGPAFATASIVKVDIAATLLLQRHGQLTKSQRAAMKRMIVSSDNGAATTLWRQIGRADGLRTANEQLGLTATVGGRGGRWGTTTTTAADQLQLLRAIFGDQSPLDPASRHYLQTLMGSVVPDQDWGISAADSRPGERYYVKNGWLPHGRGWIINSVGAVEHQGHRLLIVALSDGRPSKGSGVRVLEEAARDTALAVTGS
jgi:beta-lactamase class A